MGGAVSFRFPAVIFEQTTCVLQYDMLLYIWKLQTRGAKYERQFSVDSTELYWILAKFKNKKKKN